MNLMRAMGKKGQEMSISAIVGIVLVVVVLVLVVLGFTMGWNTLWAKINIFSGGSSNLQAVASACATSSMAGLTNDFCYEFRFVNADGAKRYINCNYPGIKDSLEKILPCPDEAEVVRGFCVGKDDATLVNDKTCALWKK